MVGKYAQRSGVRKLGACDLFRYLAATSMLNAGEDIHYVQEMLGLSDISKTQIYTHVAIEQLKEVYSRTLLANHYVSLIIEWDGLYYSGLL